MKNYHRQSSSRLSYNVAVIVSFFFFLAACSTIDLSRQISSSSTNEIQVCEDFVVEDYSKIITDLMVDEKMYPDQRGIRRPDKINRFITLLSNEEATDELIQLVTKNVEAYNCYFERHSKALMDVSNEFKRKNHPLTAKFYKTMSNILISDVAEEGLAGSPQRTYGPGSQSGAFFMRRMIEGQNAFVKVLPRESTRFALELLRSKVSIHRDTKSPFARAESWYEFRDAYQNSHDYLEKEFGKYDKTVKNVLDGLFHNYFIFQKRFKAGKKISEIVHEHFLEDDPSDLNLSAYNLAYKLKYSMLSGYYFKQIKQKDIQSNFRGLKVAKFPFVFNYTPIANEHFGTHDRLILNAIIDKRKIDWLFYDKAGNIKIMRFKQKKTKAKDSRNVTENDLRPTFDKKHRIFYEKYAYEKRRDAGFRSNDIIPGFISFPTYDLGWSTDPVYTGILQVIELFHEIAPEE